MLDLGIVLLVMANSAWLYFGVWNFVTISTDERKIDQILDLPLFKQILVSIILLSPIFFISVVICYTVMKTCEKVIHLLKLKVLYKKIYNYLWEIKE